MRKLWFNCLAMLMGLSGSSVYAQYPSGYSNVGPSSYPMQNNGLLQSVPQVPQGYNGYNSSYQLVGTGDVYGNHRAPAEEIPTPAAQGQVTQGHSYAPATGQSYAAPQAGYTAPQHNYAAPQQQGYSVPQHQHVAPPHQHIAPQHNHVAPQQGYIAPMQAPMQQAPTPAPMLAPAPMVAPMPAPMPEPNYGYGYSAPAPAPSFFGPGPSASYGYAPAPMAAVAQPQPFFASASVLLFNRLDNKNVPLSFGDASYAPDVLGTREARQGLAAGFETTIGRYFNCGKNAISATYWGIFPSLEEVSRSSATAGVFRSRIPYTYMTMAGTPAAPATPYAVYDWYDTGFAHTLQRRSYYHNVEVNLLSFAMGGAARNFNIPRKGTMFAGMGGHSCGYCGGSGCGMCGAGGACATGCGNGCSPGYGGACSTGGCNTCGPTSFSTGPCNLRAPSCGSCLNVTWLAGVRWFRFQDDLLYASSLNDTVINRAADDLYYEVNTTNDLVGFQTGCRLDYCVAKRINLYTNTKVGIYNNRSNLYTRLGTDYDHAYLADTRTPTNPNNGQDYLFDVTKNQVAFLSELGAGFQYRINCNWSGTFGYRGVVAANVATAPDNVRNSFANYSDVRDYDTYGTLILHGFNIGATYNF